MKSQKFSLISRLKRFKHAINGIKVLIKEEHNARVHFVMAFLTIFAGFYLSVSLIEWAILIGVIVLVIVLEIINSAIENLCDFVSPNKHHLIKKVKDLAAAAVLISALGAVVIGLIIFIPKIQLLFN